MKSNNTIKTNQNRANSSVITVAQDLAAKTANSKGIPIDKKKQLGSMLLEGAKAIAPTLLSAVPTVGPVLGGLAKNILSTLNDDEWFSEFKASGATFNELIACTGVETAGQALSTLPCVRMQAATAVFETCYSPTAVEDVVIPSCMAYIRKKTGNALYNDTASYSNAFTAFIQLNMLYYTMRKYEYLALHIPSNINLLPQALAPLDPSVFSAFSGIADNLEGYMRQTVSLPYALRSYIRWRFGSVFLSDNTGKPGLILYDASIEDLHFCKSSNLITDLKTTIKKLQDNIAAAGRAASDIFYAYADHFCDYTVENAHYDEKEFNLRCNLTIPGTVQFDKVNERTILLDSRLDGNAALQAVTLSTSENALMPGEVITTWSQLPADQKRCAIFPIDNTYFYFYSGAGFPDKFGPEFCYNVPNTKWYYIDITHVSAGEKLTVIAARRADNEYDLKLNANVVGQRTLTEHFLVPHLAASLQIHNIGFHNALQIDDANFHTKIYGAMFMSEALSYDRATITTSQVSSIHSMAYRNLFRGEYKKKDVKAENEEIRENIADVVQVAGQIASDTK